REDGAARLKSSTKESANEKTGNASSAESARSGPTLELGAGRLRQVQRHPLRVDQVDRTRGSVRMQLELRAREIRSLARSARAAHRAARDRADAAGGQPQLSAWEPRAADRSITRATAASTRKRC